MLRLLTALVLVITLSSCNEPESSQNTLVNNLKKSAPKHEKKEEKVLVVLETNQGNITLELFADVAPLAVENFTTHIKNGYYDGLIFHRIIKDFMIQGGDPTGTGRGGESIWKKAFKDEFKSNVVFDKAGLLAMANAGPSTNGSQFFITTRPTPWLNGRHTIFGKVVEGMDVVKTFNTVATTGRYGGDKPLEKQFIKKAYVK